MQLKYFKPPLTLLKECEGCGGGAMHVHSAWDRRLSSCVQALSVTQRQVRQTL